MAIATDQIEIVKLLDEHGVPIEAKGKYGDSTLNYALLKNREEIANRIDEAIRKTKKDNWRGHKIKERQVKNAIKKILKNEELSEKIFKVVLQQGEY